MRKLALAGALLLGACATTPRTAPAAPASWIVGTWLLTEPGVDFPAACASGLPIRYHADGRYSMVEETGTWRLEGDRLITTLRDVTEAGDRANLSRIGQQDVATVQRLGPDTMRTRFAAGGEAILRRCP